MRGKQKNEEAEKAILSIALSSGETDELARKLSVEDFVEPHHKILYETMCNITRDGVVLEPLSLSSTLSKTDQLSQLPNGAQYLTELYTSAPSSSSLSYYIKLVKEASAYREINNLVDLAKQVSSTGSSDVTPAELISHISQRLEKLAEDNVSNELNPITDVLVETLKDIVAIQNGEGVSGMPTGFKDLDDHLNGLQGGQMVIIAARPGVGKALALDTPIPTPSGTKFLSQIQINDTVYGSDGTPVNVVALSPIMNNRECYEVLLSTGERIVCDGDHGWVVNVNESSRIQLVAALGDAAKSPTTVKLTAKMIYELYTHPPNFPKFLLPQTGNLATIIGKTSSTGERSVLIEEINKTASVPVRCLQVSAENSLFLVGHSAVPTHNSSLALDIARNAAVRQNKSVVIFSLEMSAAELGMRALGAEGYVDLKLMRVEGGIDSDKWAQMQAAADRLHGKKLAIDDNPNVTIEDIKAKAKLWKQKHGLDLIVIDYIQLMNSARRFDSRQQEVSEISRGIKLLAKELEIPVIALSQLNRNSEQRSDKKPSLSDLRESGSIEQDADIVLFIHREEIYDRESPRAGEADVIIAKNRAGPTGGIVLSWLGKFSRFDNRTLL